MECCQRLHPQFIVLKEQRSSPVCQMLATAICESTYAPPAKDHFDAETPAVKGEEKVSDQKCQNPSRNARNANLAKFSRKNLAKFSSYPCAFRCSENKHLKKKKRAFYEHGFRSAGMYMSMYYMCMRMCMCMYVCICRYVGM